MSTRVPAAYLDITTEIAAVLRVTYGRAGGWHILVQPEVQFGEDMLVPDVAGWRRERLLQLPTNGVIDVVPDWTCEVVRREALKYAAYKRAGVQWFWRVFAEHGVMEALKNDEDGWLVLGAHGDDIARVEPFEAVVIEFDRLFGDYRARFANSSYTSLHSTPSSTINTDR